MKNTFAKCVFPGLASTKKTSFLNHQKVAGKIPNHALGSLVFVPLDEKLMSGIRGARSPRQGDFLSQLHIKIVRARPASIRGTCYENLQAVKRRAETRRVSITGNESVSR